MTFDHQPDIVDFSGIQRYIDCWCAGEHLPPKMMIAEQNGHYVTLDNSKGMECNVEIFATFSGAVRYLSRKAELEDYDIIDGVYSEAITARKTCDECAHWIGKEDYPPEYQYCDLYHICPTLDFFNFLTNLGMLGKCPCFEEERQ